MTLPLIGITTYGRDDNERYYLRANYVDAVRRAGGMPVLLPPGEEHAAELLSHLDGLILAGGGDIDPETYGGAKHEMVYMVDPQRDSTELSLVRQAVQVSKPTFGICRGLQVINVALGGTLIEHLPDVVGESVLHRKPEREPASHEVRVEPDSHLGRILKQERLVAQSWHHQAIRKADPALEVVAHAPDGTIEAVEMPDHPWLIGVQWHPELTAATDAIQQRLFDAFVAAAAEMLARREGATETEKTGGASCG